MPHLSDRLPRVAEGAEDNKPLPVMSFDVSRAKTVLGMDHFIDWTTTAEDTAQSLLEVMESWA